jgi:hypothetical protein
MTTLDFIAASYGTLINDGTSAVTGSFAGFYVNADAVIAAAQVDGEPVVVATAFGSASVPAGALITVPFAGDQRITSITLTSGTITLIKG